MINLPVKITNSSYSFILPDLVSIKEKYYSCSSFYQIFNLKFEKY